MTTRNAMLSNLVSLVSSESNLVAIDRNVDTSWDDENPDFWDVISTSPNYYSLVVASPDMGDEWESLREEPAVFFPIIETLGGLDMVDANRETLSLLAQGLLDGRWSITDTPTAIAANGFCPILGSRLAAAMADVQ